MKQITKAVSLLASVSIVELFLRFSRNKCVALFLGREGMGFLSQLTLFFETLRIWVNLGTRRAVIRQIAEIRGEGPETERYRQIVNSSFFINMVLSFAVGVIIVTLSPWISQWLFADRTFYPYIIGIALVVPIASLSALVGSILKGNLKYSLFSKITIAAYAAVILMVPAALFFFKYWGAVFLQLAFFLLPLLGYLWANSKARFLCFSRDIDFKVIKEQLHDGFNSIYVSTLANAPKITVAAWIAHHMGLASAGIYQLVITVTAVYLIIPGQAMQGYALPLVAAEADNQKIRVVLNEVTRLLIFLMTPLIVFLMCWPGIIIRVLYSAEFLVAAPILVVQLLGGFIDAISAPFATALVAKARLKAMYIIPTINMFLFISLSFLLFGRFGLFAPAIAYPVASLCDLLIEFSLARHYLEFRYERKNLKLVIISCVWVAAALTVALTTHSVPIRAAITASAVPWFLGCSKDHERRYISGKIRGVLNQRVIASR